MSSALQKVLHLISKTGDRCIIINPDGADAYAIMSLSEYERIALGRSEVSDLTEDELLDKINRDIAVWKSQQSNEQQTKDALSDRVYKAGAGNYAPSSNNLANVSPNYTEPHQWDADLDTDDKISDFDDDFDDEYEDEEEEPYYFEKV